MAELRVEFQEVLQVKEVQEEVLHRRERELSALKGALKEEVETHDKYMAALKEEYEQDLGKLRRDLELTKEVTGMIGNSFDFFFLTKDKIVVFLPLVFIVYNSILPFRAMPCLVIKRSRQRRREVQLRCS